MKKWEKIDDYSNKYTFSTFLKMVYSFIMTKIFWKKARIVTYPIYVHGKKKIKYGKGLSLGYNCRIDAINNKKVTLIIGENCDFGNYCHISAVNNIIIGNNFLCADSVYIGDSSHGLYSSADSIAESNPDSAPSKRVLIGSNVVIGDNVWVGEHTSILPGSSIGNGCIIGANSVVTTVIPSNSIAVGNPAKVIKIYDFEEKKWKKV